MKKIKNCPLLLAIAVFGAVFSLLGALGAKGIYQEYTKNWPKQPIIAAVFQGISDGVYPWQMLNAKASDQNDSDPFHDEGLLSTEQADEKELETEKLGEVETVTEVKEDADPKLDDVEETEAPENKTYEFTHVEEDYFDDAVFIGDSRIVGLHDYSGWNNTTYYASIGLTVYDVFDKPIVEENGTKITIEQALSEHQFGKILVMIGINEMGTGTVDSFMKAYEEMVSHLRELQPDAIIFLHGIMYVKQEKSESDPIFNNPNIQERNDRIAQLADNKNIFYLDVNEVVTDETGNLNPDYTWDEVHLLGKWYVLWTDYLKEHGIIKE